MDAQQTRRRRLLVVILNNSSISYDQLILNTQPASLISHLKLVETSGTTFTDASGNGRTGAKSGIITLNGATFLDNTPAVLLGGGYVNWYTTSLRDAFNPAKFTVVLWLREQDGVWPTSDEYFLDLFADSSNRILIRVVNEIVTFTYRAAGTSVASSSTTLARLVSTNWVQIAFSVDVAANTVLCCINGELVTTLTSLPTWAGSLTAAAFGSTSVPSLPRLGGGARVSLWSTALTLSEIQNLFKVFTPIRNILFIGDSKTASYLWPRMLGQLLRDRDGIMYHATPATFGIGGYTVADMKTFIDANLSAVNDIPDKIIFNLGTNDAFSNPIEATWKADFTSIIDSLRSKFPSVPIYVAHVWNRNATAFCVTINGWIDAVMALYPSGLYHGIDESILIENGDNGATYTDDGMHYNVAGHRVVANAWLTLL